MKQIFILFLFFTSLCVFADGLKCRVVDAKTNDFLPNAEVEVVLTTPKSSGNSASHHYLSTDSLGYFYISAKVVNDFLDWEKDCSAIVAKMTFNCFGYHTVLKSQMLFQGNDTIDIGEVKLKPGKALLKEVTVNGRYPRFTVKEDTVIFHPEAFHMDANDRLGELVAKLPGIKIQNDGIYWNNRKIKLMMDGRDVFGDGSMLMELPVEAVRNIKTYKKKSDFSARTGVDDRQGEQVLDINIKPGFLDKVYGSVTAGGNSDKTYDGRLSLNKLSKDDPLMFSGRIGRGGGTMGGVNFGIIYSVWAPNSGINDVRQQIGSLGYQHAWDSEFKDAQWRNSYDIVASANHTDKMSGRWSNEEKYMPSGSSLYTLTKADSYDHDFAIPVTFTFKKNITDKTTNELKVDVNLKKSRTTDHSESTLHDTLPELDKSCVNKSVSQDLSDSRTFSLNLNESYVHYINDGEIRENLTFSFANNEGNGNCETDYTYRDDQNANTKDIQLSEQKEHSFNVSSATSFTKSFSNAFMFRVYYKLSYYNKYSDDEIMRGDGQLMTRDLTNSLQYRDEELKNILDLTIRHNFDKFGMAEIIDLGNSNQHLDYHRGTVLDTNARRNTFNPYLGYSFWWDVTKKSGFDFGANWRRLSPDIVSTLDYYDDSNVNYHRRGNTSLHDYGMFNIDARYHFTIPKGQQNFNVSVLYSRSFDPIMDLTTYDSRKGVFLSTPTNGTGGHTEKAKLGYACSLGKGVHFGYDFEVSNSTSYSNAIVVDGDYSKGTLSQNILRWDINPHLSFDDKHWNLKLWSKINRKVIKNDDISYVNVCQLEYSTGFDIRYKISNWNFVLNPKFMGGSGFLSEEINRKRWLVDAEINWKFLNKKCQLSLIANDIFNQYNNTRSEVTAEHSYESGRIYLHHFFGGKFTYRFDAKESKKNKK